MRLLWLPDVLRAAGLTVHEYPGWRTRGKTTWGPIRGVVCHATAGSRSSTDAGELRTIAITGSVSAPAPISQLYLSRTGDWHVTASGRCNHVRTGDKGPHEGYGNSALIGVEAQNDNRGEPWSPGMLDSYQRGVAAILRRLDLSAGRAVAHREHQSGKSDPHGIDMSQFRARVARLLAGEDDDMPLSDTDLSKIRSATAKGIYDALHVAANRVDYRDLKYAGEGAIGASIRGNLTALTVAPVLAAIAAADRVDERALAAELAPALAAAVVAALPADRDDVSVDELAEALRLVLGSLAGSQARG